MSKGIDRIMTAEAERDWCGCPIVAGITAHLCGIMDDTGGHDERACADASCACQPSRYADWLDAPPGYEG